MLPVEVDSTSIESPESLDYIGQGKSYCVWEWNMKNDTIRLGPNFTEEFGYEKLEYTGEEFGDLFHEDDYLSAEELMSRAENNDEEVFTTAARFQKQSGRWVQVKTVGRFNREDGEAVGFIQDIDSKETVRSTDSFGYWEINLQSGKKFADPAIYRMLGYAPDKPETELRQFKLHPEDEERASIPIRKKIEKYGDQWSEKYRVKTKEGEWKWVKDQARVKRGPNGKPVKVVGVSIDIDHEHGESKKHNTVYVEESMVDGTKIEVDAKNEAKQGRRKTDEMILPGNVYTFVYDLMARDAPPTMTEELFDVSALLNVLVTGDPNNECCQGECWTKADEEDQNKSIPAKESLCNPDTDAPNMAKSVNIKQLRPACFHLPNRYKDEDGNLDADEKIFGGFKPMKIAITFVPVFRSKVEEFKGVINLTIRNECQCKPELQDVKTLS